MSILQEKPYVRQVPAHWSCLTWTPEKLAEIFGDETLSGRIGNNGQDILNENECEKMSARLSDFLKLEKVWYCAYMRMSEMAIDQLPWEELGLRDTGGDSCLWVGSAGSGTGLHRDAYGWNCV